MRERMRKRDKERKSWRERQKGDRKRENPGREGGVES